MFFLQFSVTDKFLRQLGLDPDKVKKQGIDETDVRKVLAGGEDVRKVFDKMTDYFFAQGQTLQIFQNMYHHNNFKNQFHDSEELFGLVNQIKKKCNRIYYPLEHLYDQYPHAAKDPQRLGAYSEELQLMVTLIVEMESVLANGRLKKLIGAIISEFKITIRQYQEFETKLIKIEKELEQL